MLRPYASSVWAITCGLRMACLLLMPYRYWPSLALAEVGPLIYQNLESAGEFGLAWTIANSIPPILYAMPVVWWCRHKLALFASRRAVAVNALFICMSLAALVWTVAIFVVLATVTQSNPYRFHVLNVVQVFLGRYIGMLTLVPLAIAFKLLKPATLRKQAVQWFKSQLTLEMVMLLLPSLAVLMWMGLRASPDAQQVIRMAMFLPAAWLTMKHGWRAAAIGIAAVTTCIFINMQVMHNAIGLVGAQAFVAFASTCLFALGTRITMQQAAEEQERLDAKAALKLAQQGIYLCEMRMRQAAQSLEQIGGTMQLTQTRLLNRFKHMLPLMEGQNYYKQAATTQSQVFRLAESMHPTAWRERGLPAALRETIGRCLDEAGFAYHFAIKGRGLSQLSPGTHAAIYRLACEALVHLCAQETWTTLTTSLRGGYTNGQRWALLRIEAADDPFGFDDMPPHTPDITQLALKLGTSGLGIDAMRDYVRLYDGDLHVRLWADKCRITFLLLDASQQVRDRHTASPALEVYIR
ncbi:MASE1 domain-containing protein [Dyella sp. 7MK23]|uniref:MASE1 domain-containing protein n=1 Tax=Dyella acidiphila TaxID=2775866 RepID=A0ABR9GFN4_9GAMM|nr:MASE1 domain-containing protein [Dyella acidiphila]